LFGEAARKLTLIKENEYARLMDAVDLLKALGNGKRLAILCRLADGEKSVSEMAGYTELSQSALSQHLAKLRELGLVKTRRDQQTIYYSLDSREVRAVIKVLHDLYCRV
jgi:ArsR family transcriptional regulator, virulence genes transcriptional regulator